MRKILLLLFPYLLLADFSNNCCYSNETFLSDGEATVNDNFDFLGSVHYQENNNVLHQFMASHGATNVNSTASTMCLSHAFKGFYSNKIASGNTQLDDGTWVRDYDVTLRTLPVNCGCNEADSHVPEQPPEGQWKIFEFNGVLGASVDCDIAPPNDVRVEWENLPESDRYQEDTTVDCCHTTKLWVKDEDNTTCPGGKVKNNAGECVVAPTCPSDNPFRHEVFDNEDAIDCQSFVGVETGQGGGDSTGSTAIELLSYSSTPYYAVGDNVNVHQVCCYQTVGNSNDDSNSSDNDDNSDNNNDDNSNNDNSSSSDANSSDSGSALTDSILKDIKSEVRDASESQRLRDEKEQADLKIYQKEIQDAFSRQYNADRQEARQQLDEMKAVNAGMTSVKNSVDTHANQAHSDSQDIKASINDLKESESSNANLAHEDSSAIKDAVDGLNEGREEANNAQNGVSDGIANATNKANENYSSVLDSFNSLLTAYTDTPPVFNGSGNHVFSTDIYGSEVRFDLSMFADLKPYFDIIFILMLAWINFKIYRWIFEFLIKIGV